LSLAICRQLLPFAASSHAHSASDEEPEAIYRQTSSLSTAWRPRCSRKCCAKLAQKSREATAGKSGRCKRLIFGILQDVSGFFSHGSLQLFVIR
jgi:hypothetical protein